MMFMYGLQNCLFEIPLEVFPAHSPSLCSVGLPKKFSHVRSHHKLVIGDKLISIPFVVLCIDLITLQISRKMLSCYCHIQLCM